jgi:hypothetical protein
VDLLWKSPAQRRVLIVVESQLLNGRYGKLGRHNESRAHSIVNHLVRYSGCSKHQRPITAALPITAFEYDAKVFLHGF